MTCRISVIAVALVAMGLSAGKGGAQEFDCIMDPAEVIELGSAATGLLDVVTVERGDTVRAGQVVARLNAQIEETTVELLRIRAGSVAVIEAQREQLKMISRRHDRVVKLRDRGVATEEALDQVEAEVIAARSNLLQAELNLDIARMELARAEVVLAQRSIRSPVDGIVRDRVRTAGEFVGSDDHILTLVRLDPLRVEAFLPVGLFGSVVPGDQAIVRPVTPLQGEYVATVRSIDRVFDAASATFAVLLDLPNPDGALPAGHRCRLFLGEG
ncbi:efflux RND transporter periplasmic adaptor subunit [Roseovarius autotrophicus]|uniref:efflux RND transporter periplasmic adaptor subunit n=1 Tax=Roseovarius autotrophicus TaxID=2824121 RepID=UPI0019EA6A93|nr:efflux RND transporter periplasmic adaptor subunit [Roseovarius autotrophicus]MBE0452531.1 efflux RND transporter periplasmic adaptor subunit [Roseovarius sp.]